MALPKWKKSQTSSGYYIKRSDGTNTRLDLKMEVGEGGKAYIINRKNGNGVPYALRKEYSLSKARKWMREYMKQNPYGW